MEMHSTAPRFQSTRPVRGGTDGVSILVLVALISIHPPRAGRDSMGAYVIIMPDKFQSTRPVRGGTAVLFLQQLHGRISIHPPRAGRDEPFSSNAITSKPFQSTRPVRGGTTRALPRCWSNTISIHPPRAGRDEKVAPRSMLDFLISIHPPRAGRDAELYMIVLCKILFQSTRPVRGGTPLLYRCCPAPDHFNPPAPCGAGPATAIM